MINVGADINRFFSYPDADDALIYLFRLVDTVNGSQFNDRIYGYDESDRLYGNAGFDRLVGGLGSDGVYGGDGNDNLFGNEGTDNLYGGRGKDNLNGGADRDRFFFATVAEAGLGKNADTIIGFDGAGDRIDLSKIDARENTGGDAFVFIGSSAFSGKEGELRYANGLIQGDTDGDKAPDFAIKIANEIMLDAGDFFL